MWWIIILALVLFFVIRFIYQVNSDKKKLAAEGGMRVRYKILIDNLLSTFTDCEILDEDWNYISIGTLSPGEFRFNIAHSKILIIEWRISYSDFWQHKLEWRFSVTADQNMMVDKISYDINAYLKNL